MVFNNSMKQNLFYQSICVLFLSVNSILFSQSITIYPDYSAYSSGYVTTSMSKSNYEIRLGVLYGKGWVNFNQRLHFKNNIHIFDEKVWTSSFLGCTEN